MKGNLYENEEMVFSQNSQSNDHSYLGILQRRNSSIMLGTNKKERKKYDKNKKSI